MGLLSDKEVQKLQETIKTNVKEAMNKAIATPWPDKSTSMDHLFSEDVDISDEFDNPSEVSGKEDVPMAQSINKVLRTEVEKNSLIRVFGEDVADFSEVEKYEKGLKGKGGVLKFLPVSKQVVLKIKFLIHL